MYITGSQINIDTALQMIREKFPLKRYPEVTLEQMPIHAPVALTPDQLHVSTTYLEVLFQLSLI